MTEHEWSRSLLGGSRSAKSRYAKTLVAGLPPPRKSPWNYIATAEPGDAEMAGRITAHRSRRGAFWRIIKAPRALATALQSSSAGAGIERGADDVELIGCFCLGYPEAENMVPKLEQAGWEERSAVSAMVVRR